MERLISELAPDPALFAVHFQLVQDYVRSGPGAHAALMTAAREDPEGVTMSIVALGAVLLDVAAGAFRITPDQMLDKIATGVADVVDEGPAL